MPYRPPALSIVTAEVLEQLYVKPRGSSKRKYNGLSYECLLCKSRIVNLSPNEHYRVVHQSKASIRFGEEGKEYEVKRSRTTNLFECPRCDSLFRHPRHIQDHAAAWHGACPISSTSVESPVKPSRSSTSANSTPQARRTRRRRTESTPQTPQTRNSTSVARPLKTPTRTRTGIPNISRTFRAVIRQCYNQRTMSNKEIAEYCNCDVRDVYFAVNNESGDNLDEDPAYLDGKLGDIVNIDNVDASILEAVYHDDKLDKDMDEDEDADGQTDGEHTGRQDPRAKAYPTPESDPPYGARRREHVDDAGYDSEEEIERILSAVDLDPPSDVEMFDDSAPHHDENTHDVFTSRPTQAPQHQSSLFQVSSPDPVYAFFSTLPKTTPEDAKHLSAVFKVYGVESSEDLDMLSQMEGCWPEVGNYVCGRGVTQDQWLQVCDALRARRARVLGKR